MELGTFRPKTGDGMWGAKYSNMIPTTDFVRISPALGHSPSFWERILKDDALSGCDDMEKLLAGCEIIAALDGVDLLAA